MLHATIVVKLGINVDALVITLETFLQSVEKRAFRMARLAVHNDADALDIVQDSMIKLATNYGDKSSDEWRPLFFTILNNCIHDWHRKDTRWRRWFVRDHQDDDEEESLLEMEDDYGPIESLQNEQMGKEILDAVEALPIKQQQCFLLRCWEGFSVQETAKVMEVNEGSVKTHYHRAMKKIQEVLQEGHDERR